MPIYVVRHAKAVSQRAWEGDDRQRPLVEDGWTQARLLVQQFANETVTMLLSSPFLRCQQTLEPLSAWTGLPVVVDNRLAENTDSEIVRQLLVEVPDGAVLCSHGDVIPSVLGLLERDGMSLNSWCDTRKSATAILDRVGKSFVAASFWAPPA